ncbi:MAG: serine/threonine-protein kinase [Coriobacteriia bacterium]
MGVVHMDSGEWELHETIGSGGFGSVHRARQGEQVRALKLVPKDPGADRELLLADLDQVRNVIPVLEVGETVDEWVLAMPLAETSLREYVSASAGLLPLEEVVCILRDVATALADMDGRVVHRDLKPENLLRWNGAWCLADFGISRYVEATTAEETRKHFLSRPYAAPERWRLETAASSTDVYSLGVVAYELLSGNVPFAGPSPEDYRHQHLHEAPAALEGVPPSLAALVEECLYKAPGSRPSPANILARLERAASTPESSAALKLMEANRAEVGRQSEAKRAESVRQTEKERRSALRSDAAASLGRIGDALKEMVIEAAPAASPSAWSNGEWGLLLGTAELSVSRMTGTGDNVWGHYQPVFDVVAHASIAITIPRYHDYAGRSHSLWFCDAQEEGRYAWYETAFMVTPMVPERGVQDPFALDPGEDAGVAVSPVMGRRQLAWPFVRLDGDGQAEFFERWIGWFADAAAGRLSHPSTMPERSSSGSYRTK